jgi:prephenate dehydrogenase
MTRLRTLAVVGVGLIGGSFARALRAAGAVERVIGVGRTQANQDVALRDGLIDQGVALAPGWAAAARAADVILLATPVSQYAGVLRDLVPQLAPHALVTDAGSTKQDVIDTARSALGTAFARFVPGHPIAGSDRAGAGAADAALFRGREVILTPVAQTDSAAIATVRWVGEAVGAHVTTLEPAYHDRVLAAVSHLPHLVAFAYMDALAARPDAAALLAHAGSGFRDFTRIAGSVPQMWRDIALSNRAALADELRAFRAALDGLADALAQGDAPRLDAQFARAADLRHRWAALRAGEDADDRGGGEG